jgi:hypothetical protein
VIPKALSWAHIEANAESVDFTIDESDRRRIDVATKREVTMIEPDLVKIEGQGMYLSLDDACANARGFCPAPDVLAQEVRRHGIIKPIRVRVSRDNASYVLTEGQVRYWAWVMAFGLKRPVPTYIRTE